MYYNPYTFIQNTKYVPFNPSKRDSPLEEH